MSSAYRHAPHYNSHRSTGDGFNRPSRDNGDPHPQQQRHHHHHRSSHSSRSGHGSYSPRSLAADPAKAPVIHPPSSHQKQAQATGPEVRLPFQPSKPPTTTHRPASATASDFLPPPPPKESAQQPSKKSSIRPEEKISFSQVKPPVPKASAQPSHSSGSRPALTVKPKVSQPQSTKRPAVAVKTPQVQKKQKTSAPTTTWIRPASFLVPSAGPSVAAHPNPSALVNYPKKLTVSQMIQRHAEDKKKRSAPHQQQQGKAPVDPEVLCIDDDVSSKQPQSSRSSGSSSSRSSISSGPQSVASLFDEIEAMPNESPVVVEEPPKPNDEELLTEDEDQPDSEPEFNQVRVNRWQPKHYDSTIFSVSHCQGKANEQLQLPLLEDNEEIVSLVNKGRHCMSVRPGLVKTALVDFRQVFRVFKNKSKVVHDVYLKPKPDLSLEVKDLEKIATVCQRWIKAGHAGKTV